MRLQRVKWIILSLSVGLATFLLLLTVYDAHAAIIGCDWTVETELCEDWDATAGDYVTDGTYAPDGAWRVPLIFSAVYAEVEVQAAQEVVITFRADENACCGGGVRVAPFYGDQYGSHTCGSEVDVIVLNTYQVTCTIPANVGPTNIGLRRMESGANIYYHWIEIDVIESSPPPDPPDLFGFCVFTGTVTVTDTNGITSTQQVSYTRPVNRLRNYSFEQQSGPGQTSAWQTVVNGAHTNVPGHWFQLPGLARSGTGVVYNSQAYELWQSMTVYTSGLYVAGFYATGPGAGFKWNGVPIASSSTVAEGYDVFSGTYPAVAGSGLYMIVTFDGDDPTYVDDAFVYYTNDPETLLPACEAGAYEPFDPGSWGDDTDIIGGIPAPIGGAGATCYSCIPPANASAAGIAYWIAWLGCVIRNMFSCSLRVWLLNLGNWSNGIIQYMIAFAAWVPLTAQQGANWFAGSMVPGMGGYTIVNTGSNFIDLLIAIIGLIQTLVQSLSNLLYGIVQLVTSLLQLIPTALAAEPFELTFAGGEPGAGLEAAGPNDDKRLYAFLLFMGVVDQMVLGHTEVEAIMMMAMGALTLSVIFWVGYFWRDVIHI